MFFYKICSRPSNVLIASLTTVPVMGLTKHPMSIDTPGACIIKLITAVIYSFGNKLGFVLKYYTRLERLARDKHSSLLQKP